MKGTKVYVDELAESCVSCKYFAEHRRQCNLEICLQWSEDKFKFNDCPLHSIKDHDREKDKQIKELEQKVQELQEVDNKRAFRLYCVLYNELEKQCPENVASRIDFMTSENYADICELYKTAKNLKQHDRELVKEVCEKIRKFCENNKYRCNKYFLLYSIGLNVKLLNKNKEGQKETFYEFLDQLQKEFEK